MSGSADRITLPGRFRGVVFDLDGTLVDSEPAWGKAKSIVAARHGRSISAAQLSASVGRSMDDLVADVFAPGNRAAARAIEEEIFAEAATWLPQMRVAVPGAAAFLGDIHRLGLPVAICSSSPEHLIRDALGQIGVLELVRLVVSADPMPQRKPHPMPYLVTAERLGLRPGDLIAIEDALPGARSASAAGYFTIAVGAEVAADPAPFDFCDLLAGDYAELRGLLDM
ncbi:sugar-phosphatase [Paracoccus isoporae]|uniref:Sugar-phosphatase n=1 Tax=Paracoccus isoporae TaxID=591205 RepID=A0A1G6V4X1_9RHOB|nr:HAD family phosphatase [Paracoccus isoporae]SDD48622.1 sugar-phosphatase [Paracoccus isoporae]